MNDDCAPRLARIDLRGQVTRASSGSQEITKGIVKAGGAP